MNRSYTPKRRNHEETFLSRIAFGLASFFIFSDYSTNRRGGWRYGLLHPACVLRCSTRQYHLSCSLHWFQFAHGCGDSSTRDMQVVKWLKIFVQGKIDQYRDWQNPDREANPMECPEVVVDGVDPVLYEKLLAEATAAGAVFEGDEVTFKGCRFLWAYDGSQSFRYTCKGKPFYFTCGLIDAEISKLVTQAKGGI